MSTRDPARNRRGSIYLGVAGGLFAISGALVGGYFVLGKDARADASKAPRRADGSAAPASADPGDLGHQVGELLDDPVIVVVAGHEIAMRWSDLGVVVDEAEVEHSAKRAASDEPIASLKTAGALPLKVDREAAITALTALKG